MERLISRQDRERMEAVMAAIHRCTSTDDLISNATTPDSQRYQLAALLPDYLKDAKGKVAHLSTAFPRIEDKERVQMTALTQFTALLESKGGSFMPYSQQALKQEARLQRFETEADNLRGTIQRDGVTAQVMALCWTFATRAKLAFPDQGREFTVLQNIKTDWPSNWTDLRTGKRSFVHLASHVVNVMRSVREVLEGVEA